jgi:hypothetical protein
VNPKQKVERLEQRVAALQVKSPPDPEVERLAGLVDLAWMACSYDGPTEFDTEQQWQVLYAIVEEYWKAVEASGLPDPYPDFRRLKKHTREPMTPRWWPLRWHPEQAAVRAAGGMGFVYAGDLVMLAGTDMVFRRHDAPQPQESTNREVPGSATSP